MTPRERWLSLFNNEKPDRIPTDYWATPEVTERLLKELHCADVEALYTKLGIDGIVKINPPRTRLHHPDDPEADHWGIRRRMVAYAGGQYPEFDNRPVSRIASVEDVDAYRWPSPDDHDYDEFARLIRNAPPHRIVQTGDYEPFLLYCAMRGLDQALADLLTAPEIVEAALSHMFEYHVEVNQRAFEIGKGRIDMTFIAEDLGGQRGLLMSPEQIRRFILPNQRRMADLARSYGFHIFYHTDGDARDIIPDLIAETGIEVLNPIQWRCPSMERKALVRDFGDKIIFHGAMDNQQTLPFGSVDDVRSEVLENIQIFSSSRWICAPCHNIQPLTPTENIVAMYRTIHEHGSL